MTGSSAVTWTAEPKSFEQWWNVQGEWVEAPNQRRGGESGVMRAPYGDGIVYIKRQSGHIYRSLRHPLGRPTVLREQEALTAIGETGVELPEVVYCGARRVAGDWQAVLVTRDLAGYRSLEDLQTSGDWGRLDTQSRATVLQHMAATIARLHNSGWQHGCLYDKHLFIALDAEIGDCRVALLDMEKCRKRRNRASAAERDLDQLERHSSFEPDEWDYLQYLYRKALSFRIRGLGHEARNSSKFVCGHGA